MHFQQEPEELTRVKFQICSYLIEFYAHVKDIFFHLIAKFY